MTGTPSPIPSTLPALLTSPRQALALVLESDPACPSAPHATLIADAVRTHCPGIDTRTCAPTDTDALAALSRRADIALCAAGPIPATRFNALSRLLLLAPELPIILFAPANEPAVADEALRVGAHDAILCAPGYLDHVPLAVRKALTRQRAHSSQVAKIDALTRSLESMRTDVRTLQGLVDRLEALSTIDPLTGLGNRRLLDERLASLLSAANRHDVPLCILSIDVDGLKTVNDTLGHAAGDETLQTLARVLASACRESDTVARIGGDEFIILLPHTASAAGMAVAKRINDDFTHATAALRKRLSAANAQQSAVIHVLAKRTARAQRPFIPGLSIGIAARDLATRVEAASLLTTADQAMYRAKSSGKGHAEIGTPQVTVIKHARRAAA
jgi:diguanylate cyclase (GGDEF)-like protein